MTIEKVQELAFDTYEEAAVYIDRQILAGGGCMLKVRGSHFIVEVFITSE